MTGITVKQFADYKAKLFDRNGGDRSFSILTEQCYDKVCPFGPNEETNIRITHPLHDVHQLQDTFLYLEFRLQGVGGPNVNGRPWQTTYFLGWKDASQIFKTLKVYSNNAETGYFQRDCAKEGLLKSLETPNEQCLSRLYENSDCNQVYERESCCGAYILINSNRSFDVSFQVILPISSLLAFENIKDIFAPALDITLKFSLNFESLSLGVVRYGKLRVQNYNNENKYLNRTGSYHLPCYAAYAGGACARGSLKLTCTRCTCECYGYTVPPSVKQNLFQMSQQPLVIPCRKLEIVTMPDKFKGTTNSYTSVIHHSLDNVRKILIMNNHMRRLTFTVYQLYIDGQLYPASDYMQYLSKEQARYAASYVRNLNPKGTIKKGLVNNIVCNDDRNNFLDFSLPFQLKRNNKYDVYDGKDSGGTQVPLEVRLQTENNLVFDTTVELWLIRDCAWILDANGLRFVNHPGQVLTGKELGWIRHRPEEPAKMRNTQH